MADAKGFLKINRKSLTSRSVDERLQDYKEVYIADSESITISQSARCMDCGVPFCNHGCPLGNLIPDFNNAVCKQEWQKAYNILNQTNNFPEFTGRICPAPCEAACVLGINNEAVTIENIEKQIIEKAFENNWINTKSNIPASNHKIAIIGSGPAGLAAADQLNKAGHHVTIYEKSDQAGGLLRYGIPDFKLEKWVVDRRIDLLQRAGIEIITNTEIGKDININEIKNLFDAIVLCGGSSVPRDIDLVGREASGIYFAMEYLEMSNKYVKGKFKSAPPIFARDKHVVVIGGGDTGADCVGTANRQGAASVTQIELLFKPSQQRNNQDPWPLWPMILRTSSSHEEGCERKWSIQTKRYFKDDNGNLTGLEVEDIEWKWNEETQRYQFTSVPNSLRIIDCNLIFIAAGFLHPKQEGIIKELGLEIDDRGNISTKNYQTNYPGIFAAGDMRRGQSLVVWAISEGREAARAVDQFLMGHTRLESKNSSSLVMV